MLPFGVLGKRLRRSTGGGGKDMRGSAATEEMRGIPVSSSSLSVSTSSSDASECRLLRRLLNDSFSSEPSRHDNRLPNEFRLSKSVSPECAAVVKERARDEYGANREERRLERRRSALFI